uniref:EGF-like domain-containing protein n=2 Tax=Steinernema glaseri TaxID=37863 RepID=A0A1I8AD30_9BILA
MRLLWFLILFCTFTCGAGFMGGWFQKAKSALGFTSESEADPSSSRAPCGAVGFCFRWETDGKKCGRCDCPEGFKDPDCRPERSECSYAEKSGCGKDEVCMIDDFGTPQCHCPQEGCLSEEPAVPSMCQYCQNNASCSEEGCICPTNYFGTFFTPNCNLNSKNRLTRHGAKSCACNKKENLCHNNGTCIPHENGIDTSCLCPYGYSGEHCEYEIPCVLNDPCQHGGECGPNPTDHTKVSCECLSIWTGDQCQIYNACHDVSCVYGNCTFFNITRTRCLCEPGYTGLLCDQDIDECAEEPCQYSGTCINKLNDYDCICPEGSSGKSCEILADNCGTHKPSKTKCNMDDRKAKCQNMLNDYQCICGPDYTGEHCETPIIVWEALEKIGFENGTGDGELKQILIGIKKEPLIVKEIIPFLMALQQTENQTRSSWDFDDLFDWAAFEGVQLDAKRDFVKWNNRVLGNCFTFNHDSQPDKFPLRYAGEREGFRAMMRVRQDEYVDWEDTASLLVFVHPTKESIFGESLRFQAKPGEVTNLMISEASFERLGGVYGKCVKDKSEVSSYYYLGGYTVDGCFRSCYQDAVLKSCDCMDPRYPMPSNVTGCELRDLECVMEVTRKRGDPSKWPECHCPLACSNSQYSVRVTHSSFPKEFHCDSLKRGHPDAYRNCLMNATLPKDRTAMINVYFPELIQTCFREEAKMDFNKFISMLGGLLSILMGFSFLTAVEFFVLVGKLALSFFDFPIKSLPRISRNHIFDGGRQSRATENQIR